MIIILNLLNYNKLNMDIPKKSNAEIVYQQVLLTYQGFHNA